METTTTIEGIKYKMVDADNCSGCAFHGDKGLCVHPHESFDCVEPSVIYVEVEQPRMPVYAVRASGLEVMGYVKQRKGHLAIVELAYAPECYALMEVTNWYNTVLEVSRITLGDWSGVDMVMDMMHNYGSVVDE